MARHSGHGPDANGRVSGAFLTVSVDDGHPDDLRTADLLDELGLQATFYVPARNAEGPVLSDPEIRGLAERFELGAHTYHHVVLPGLPPDEARREVADGKAWLEDVTGRQVASFCYPRGKYDAATVRLVAEQGFAGARTCRQHLLGPPRSAYLWGVSTHARSRSKGFQIRQSLGDTNWSGAGNFVRVFRGADDWEQHFGRALAHVARHGGVAHLYLHSWEIGVRDEWGKLRRTLERARSEDVHPVTNGELFAMHRAG